MRKARALILKVVYESKNVNQSNHQLDKHGENMLLDYGDDVILGNPLNQQILLGFVAPLLADIFEVQVENTTPARCIWEKHDVRLLDATE